MRAENRTARDATAGGLWKRPSAWLGVLEIAVGGSVAIGGCWSSLVTDASLAGIGALISFVAGTIGLALPGALLLKQHPARWVAQLLPVMLTLWIAC